MTKLHADFRRIPLAHRALHDVGDGRPENSRAAIRAAMAAGYGIEIDLQLSRDGRAMVFHDYDLTRLTGVKGVIQQRDATDLSQIALLGGMRASRRSQKCWSWSRARCRCLSSSRISMARWG